MRLLLVEHDERLAARLATGLRAEGFPVDIAESADAANARLRAACYAAIVVDWKLPDADGPSLCAELRARGVTTPILIVTARRSLGDRVTGLDAGADDVLAKPFALVELVVRLRTLLLPFSGSAAGGC
jgi:DNA-binding response OmpR family regulator